MSNERLGLASVAAKLVDAIVVDLERASLLEKKESYRSYDQR